MWSKIKPYVVAVAIPLAVGAVAGWLTKDSFAQYMTLRMPALSPPPWLFPVVWTILYVLMGLGSARIALAEGSGRSAASLFWLMLLVVLIVGMIKRFAALDKWAAYGQIPYLLWSLFALYLNAAVWWLNR